MHEATARKQDFQDFEEEKKNISNIVRTATTRELHKIYNEAIQFEIDEVEKHDDFLYGYRMAFLLLSGSKVQITYKAHFFSDDIKPLVAQGLKKDPTVLSDKIVLDYMKEYCNLVAGEIKKIFADNNIIVGLSLPLLTRGFDEVNLSDDVDERIYNDYFKVTWGAHSFVVSFVAEIQEWNLFSTIDIPEVNEGGDINFL